MEAEASQADATTSKLTSLALSVYLFGIDAATGPLQVTLLMSAVVGAVVAQKNGHSWQRLGEEVVEGISIAMSTILILLMVGAPIGVWNMSGTIATVIYYGIKYIDPTWFYFAAALLTGVIGSIAPGVFLGTLLRSPQKFVPVASKTDPLQVNSI